MRTGKCCRLFSCDSAEGLQIGLVADKHGDDVWTRVIAQFFDPPLDTSEC